MVSSNTSMLYAIVLSRLLFKRDAKEGGGGGSELNVTMTLSVPKSVWRCPLTNGTPNATKIRQNFYMTSIFTHRYLRIDKIDHIDVFTLI